MTIIDDSDAIKDKKTIEEWLGEFTGIPEHQDSKKPLAVIMNHEALMYRYKEEWYGKYFLFSI